MIQLPVYDTDGKKVDTLSIDEALLGGTVRPLLLKQAYVMFHANRRQGSARTRGRSGVTGSTRKLYRQKGTGNARVGASRTNIRRGGGVAFAKRKTRTEYHLDMPKKMRRFANRNALLAKLTDEEVKCITDLSFREPRTRDLKALLDTIGIDRSCLIALNRSDRMTALSARNLPGVRTLPIEQLNAFELLNHRYLVVDKTALSAFLDGSVWAGEPKQEAAG